MSNDVAQQSPLLARALVGTELYERSRRERKKIEMLFAQLKRIIGLIRLRLRVPTGAKDEFLLAATAQNLRKLVKLIVPAMPQRLAQPSGIAAERTGDAGNFTAAEFFNDI